MIRWLLCPGCRRAWSVRWLGLEVCDLCGQEPIEVNPRSGDAIAWYQARPLRTAGIAEVLARGVPGWRLVLVRQIRRRNPGRWSFGMATPATVALRLGLAL